MNVSSLVSVIVPTKNSEEFLEACLKSIRNQSYNNIELIVVDNYSTDNTSSIAKKYADKFFLFGPERSAQVNHGVEKAKGTFVYKVDSDFILDKDVISECVEKAKAGFDAVVVHNTPDETVSWIAKIRKFEVDMYKYDLTHSSARFVKKNVYKKIKGFNESVTAGEDYDFQNKLNREGFKTGFVAAEALHLGEPKRLWPHLKKYYFYGKDFINYKKLNESESKEQLKLNRSIYKKRWSEFVLSPVMSVNFFLYNTAKYTFAGAGYFVGKLTLSKSPWSAND